MGLAWWNLDWEAREEKRFYGYPRSARHRDPITNEVFTSGLLVTCITYYIIYTARHRPQGAFGTVSEMTVGKGGMELLSGGGLFRTM